MPVAEADGLVLVEDVVVSRNSSPATTTRRWTAGACDRPGCHRTGRDLRVVGRQMAGVADPGLTVGPGEAVRIMTGAPIPAGVDAVEMVERTSVSDGNDRNEAVTLSSPCRSGSSSGGPARMCRPASVCCPPGPGSPPPPSGWRRPGRPSAGDGRPTPPGRCRVDRRRLVTEDRPLRTGELRGRNRPGLLAAVARMGAEAVDLGRVPDDEALIEAVLLRGAEDRDLVPAPAGCRWGCRPGQGDPRSTRRCAGWCRRSPPSHWPPARLDRPRWWACRATRCRRTCPSCCSSPADRPLGRSKRSDPAVGGDAVDGRWLADQPPR